MLGIGLAECLYTFHSGIEALAGSMLVIRGRGAMDAQGTTCRSRLYRRWHGCGLLGLSSLGVLVLANGKVHDSTTRSIISWAFCLFHGGATAVHFWAVVEGSSETSKEKVSFKEAAMSPHLLLSLGFAAHAAGILK
eukprot:symbB.v1.2.018777.t1/scaffold1511.1/size114522/4